jgi:hypothetical protein
MGERIQINHLAVVKEEDDGTITITAREELGSSTVGVFQMTKEHFKDFVEGLVKAKEKIIGE